MDSNHQLTDLESAVLPLELLIHKIGGGRGNRTLLVSNLARVTRSPLLPPIKTSLLRTLGSNQSNQWLTVTYLHLACILRSKEVSFFAKDYTASSLAYASSNFCPSTALAANNTFLTPTGPTLLIVRQSHLLELPMHTWLKPGKSLPGRFPSTHLTKCCLSILVALVPGARFELATNGLSSRCSTTELSGC